MLGETEAAEGTASDDAQQALLVRVFAGVLMAAFVMVLSLAISSEYGFAAFRQLEHDVGTAHGVLLLVAVPALLLLGVPVARLAWRDLRGGRLSLNVLFALGTSSAVAVSLVSYLRGTGPIYIETAVMLLALYTLGRYLTARAKGRTTRVLQHLLDVPSTTYDRLQPSPASVRADALRVSDRVRIRAGDVIPVDGRVTDGTAYVDESSLTGEAKPALRATGERVYAGTAPVDGPLVIDVTAVADDRRLARVEQMMRRALEQPPRVQRLADRIMHILIPGVIVLALLTFAGWFVVAGFEKALYTSLSVVLITCPCALGIAIPLSLVVGLGEAARDGVLVRDGDTLLDLARVDTLLFDKTGTLTSIEAPSVEVHLPGAPAANVLAKGTPVGTGIHDAGEVPGDGLSVASAGAFSSSEAVEAGRRRVLGLAAALESTTRHPLARAIGEAAEAAGIELPPVTETRTIAGAGVIGRRADPQGDGEPIHRVPSHRSQDRGSQDRGSRERVAVGNDALLNRLGIAPGNDLRRQRENLERAGHTSFYVAEGNEVTAVIALRETVPPASHDVVDRLRGAGLDLQVLTGDRPAAADHLARDLGLEVHAGLSPEDKVDYVRRLHREGAVVAMVGDGINDAAAIAEADVGVARTSGAGVSLEASGIGLYHPELRILADLHALARRTERIIHQNLWWTFGYNGVGLGLAVAGLLHPIAAVTVMAASSAFVTWNAFRIREEKTEREG